ncbi:hypothetical protein ACTXT7_007950 [Hymenolepis weldensis]
MSVFSFAWVSDSTKYTDLAIKWSISSWPSSLFLRSSKSTSFTKEISLFGILTNHPKKKFRPCSIFFLVLDIYPMHSNSVTAHILHFDARSVSLRCLQKFEFGEVVCVRDTQEFLEGIVSCFSSNAEKVDGWNAVLTAALFIHDDSSLARHLYLCLALKFLYRYLGNLSSLFSHLRVELNASRYYIWGTILPILAESSRPDPESALDDIGYFFQHMEYFSLVNKRIFPEDLMQWVFENVWRTNFANLPMASMIFERFLLPYISDVYNCPQIIFPWFLLGVMRSKYLCNAFTEFHPRMFQMLMENTYVLQATLESFENVCPSLAKWMERSFRLYCHCLHQLGHFETILPSQVFCSKRRNRNFDNLVKQFERFVAPPKVPRLASLTIKVARFHIRQMTLSKPLPRPSFSSQLDSLSTLPPNIKRLIKTEGFEWLYPP